MKWKKLKTSAWGSQFSKKFDFVVTREKGRFILDIFNKRIKDTNKAYIDSFELSSLKEAKYDAENYI